MTSRASVSESAASEAGMRLRAAIESTAASRTIPEPHSSSRSESHWSADRREKKAAWLRSTRRSNFSWKARARPKARMVSTPLSDSAKCAKTGERETASLRWSST